MEWNMKWFLQPECSNKWPTIVNLRQWRRHRYKKVIATCIYCAAKPLTRQKCWPHPLYSVILLILCGKLCEDSSYLQGWFAVVWMFSRGDRSGATHWNEDLLVTSCTYGARVLKVEPSHYTRTKDNKFSRCLALALQSMKIQRHMYVVSVNQFRKI